MESFWAEPLDPYFIIDRIADSRAWLHEVYISCESLDKLADAHLTESNPGTNRIDLQK
jgi:hypothetical protein